MDGQWDVRRTIFPQIMAMYVTCTRFDRWSFEESIFPRDVLLDRLLKGDGMAHLLQADSSALPTGTVSEEIQTARRSASTAAHVRAQGASAEQDPASRKGSVTYRVAVTRIAVAQLPLAWPSLPRLGAQPGAQVQARPETTRRRPAHRSGQLSRGRHAPGRHRRHSDSGKTAARPVKSVRSDA